MIARLIGARMTEITGQTIVVDNRGGAGGVLGTELVARPPGDGYTLLLHSAAIAYQPALRAKLPYDALKDLAPISRVGATPNLLVVNPAFRRNPRASSSRSRSKNPASSLSAPAVSAARRISQSNCSAHCPERHSITCLTRGPGLRLPT